MIPAVSLSVFVAAVAVTSISATGAGRGDGIGDITIGTSSTPVSDSCGVFQVAVNVRLVTVYLRSRLLR